MKKIYWTFCALLLALGFLMRFWGIWHGSFAFTYDAGRDLLAVRDLVYNHRISLIGPTSGQMGIFYGPWWYWFLALPFAVSGGSPAFILFCIAVYALLGAFIVFWWSSRRNMLLFGLLFGGLLSVSPFAVGATTQLWSPDLIPTTLVLVLLLLYDFNKLSLPLMFVLGMLLMLVFEMELMFGALLISGLCIALFLFYRDRLLPKKLFAVGLGFLLIELPRIFFDARHGFLQFKNLLNLLGSPSNSTIYFDIRLKLIQDKLYFLSPVDNIATVLLISAVFIYLVVKYGRKNTESEGKYIKALSVILLVFVAFVFFYQKEVWDYYLLGWPVFIAALIAVLANSISVFRTHLKLGLSVIFIYLLAVSRPVSFIDGLKNPWFTGNAAVYRNQLEAVDYVYLAAKGMDFNVTPYTPPQIEYTWRYLFSWYGKSRYGYEPAIRRSERLFMVMEPDPGYEGRITNWLKVRENDGKVIGETTLRSGIIIQSRIRPKE